MHLYQQPGSSNLIRRQLEVGVHLNLFSMARVKNSKENVQEVNINWPDDTKRKSKQ